MGEGLRRLASCKLWSFPHGCIYSGAGVQRDSPALQLAAGLGASRLITLAKGRQGDP